MLIGTQTYNLSSGTISTEGDIAIMLPEGGSSLH